MLTRLKRTMVLSLSMGALGVVGSALAASPALAYHINRGTNGSGGAAPLGAAYSMHSSNFTFLNSAGNAIFRCTSSTLSGATTTASGAISNQLNVTSGSFSGCDVIATGQPLTLTGSYSPAWVFNPTGGGPSPSTPFTGTLSNIRITLSCGSNSQTFGGTLSTGASENNVAGASNLAFNNAQSLSQVAVVGTGCGWSSPTGAFGVSGVYTLVNVGGSPVSASNNLWLLQNWVEDV